MRRLALLSLLVLSTGAADARPLKGQGPTAMATGYGAVWVGFGDGRVIRVEEQTLERRSLQIGTPGRGYVFSIATGSGGAWVAAGGLEVHRLDPRTAKVRATVRNQPGAWTGAPTQVAVGSGFAWVGDSERDAVLRVSLRTNRVGRRTVVRGRLRSLAAGPKDVWAQVVPKTGPINGPQGPRIVSRLSSRTMRLHAAFRSTCDSSLQPVGRFLWVLDNCDGKLRRFDGRALGPPIETAPDSWGLARGFGSLWVSNGSSILRVDPARRAVVATVDVVGHHIAAGKRFVWALDSNGTGWLRRIDPRTNRVVGRPLRL